MSALLIGWLYVFGAAVTFCLVTDAMRNESILLWIVGSLLWPLFVPIGMLLGVRKSFREDREWQRWAEGVVRRKAEIDRLCAEGMDRKEAIHLVCGASE